MITTLLKLLGLRRDPVTQRHPSFPIYTAMCKELEDQDARVEELETVIEDYLNTYKADSSVGYHIRAEIRQRMRKLVQP